MPRVYSDTSLGTRELIDAYPAINLIQILWTWP